MNYIVLRSIVSVARLDARGVLKYLYTAGENESFGKGPDGPLMQRIYRLSQRQSEQSA